MQDADFSFTVAHDAGIASIVVTRMRLTLKHAAKRRITLEADTTDNSKAVYELRDKLKPPAHFITQLGVKVTFMPVGDRRAKTRTFNITYPNSCALNYDGNDAVIRKMLADSGIEPALQSD